jgi:uncharacterized membrane protein
MAFLMLWYLAISLVGWLTFPLAFRLLPGLADRGYAASRALGWLLWGYTFWLLASLQILRNDVGSLVFALGVLAALSLWSWRKLKPGEIRAWWYAQRWQVLIVEILFLVAFVSCGIVRAANPEAVGTEKPMDLAFINAILASPTFPPHDPWLSGYAISYYYFGHVLVAMLAKLTGAPGGVAFNLGVALVFALSATGAYGMVYNLLAARNSRKALNLSAGETGGNNHAFAALLGPLFILVVSNLEGFLHMLHQRGLFWQHNAAGEWASRFWIWLDIKDLNLPPAEPLSWAPTRFWWWWRASRVLQDYDLARNPKEIIDEFPAFSYLLADLHPHVLAMPFAFLAMALALNAFLGGNSGLINRLQARLNVRTFAWAATLAIPAGLGVALAGLIELRLFLAAVGILLLTLAVSALARIRHTLGKYGLGVLLRGDLGELTIGSPLAMHKTSFLLAAVVLGGMAFLNTWDFPIYVALFAAAHVLGRAIATHKKLAGAGKEFIWLGLTMGVSGGLLYLPFYLGFASQVGGILPNLIYPTRGAHLWVMFAPLLLPILAYLVYLLRSGTGPKGAWRTGFLLVTGLILALWGFTLLLGVVIVIIPQVGEFYQATLASSGTTELFKAALLRRVTSPGGWITLTILLLLALLPLLRLERFFKTLRGGGEESKAEAELASATEAPPSLPLSPVDYYTLLLVLFGTLLALGVEFVYLRDQFGWRMNTIFKFYFQIWLLWGVAAAFASAVLLANLRRGWALAFGVGLVILLAASLVYPAFGLWSKAGGFQSMEWTLDSTAYFKQQSPDEWAAVQWLRSAPQGVVAEAVPIGGGSNTEFARMATLSGQPGLLGWIGHESQWRGGYDAMGSRQSDLERLYCSRDWNETRDILNRYHIRYVVVSGLERSNYPAGQGSCTAGLVESKFSGFLQPVFQQGQATIYEYLGADQD